MSSQALDESPFAPDIFFPRAMARLDPAPLRSDVELLGDHHLNPHLSIDGIRFREAAVLIPVVARQPGAGVLLTLRTPHLVDHAGQIAFPGGKLEPQDGTPAAAALREAGEEIGLAADMVEPLGYLDAYLTRTGYRITPVLGRVDPAYQLTINPNEVVEAFEVPLAFLMCPDNHRQGSRVVTGILRHFYDMAFEDRRIWGITAGIIRALYQRIYG